MKSTSSVKRVPAAAPWLAAPVIALLAMNCAALADWMILYPPPGTTYTKWSDVAGYRRTATQSYTFTFRFMREDDVIMQEKEVTSDEFGNWNKTLPCPENGWFVGQNHYVDLVLGMVQKAKNQPIKVVGN